MADEKASANGQGDSKLDNVPTAKIRENAVALRPVDKESEGYLQLADSVKKRGILNPILVREFEDPDNPGNMLYGLIDGLQRYNAALDAGMKTIPAKIVTMDQAEIEENQIIANATRIETRPYQYAEQLGRLLERNPTMGINDLAGKLSKSPGWIYKMLGMIRNVNKDLEDHINDGRIKLSNAYELSKLPKEEQPQWSDRAMTQDPGEFTAAVAARVKAIKEARKKGKPEGPVVFEPVVHSRKWAEIKAEYQNKAMRDPLINRNKLTTAADGWDMAIAWCCHMDPDSQAHQRTEHEAREAENKAQSEKRKLERAKQKEEEAAKTRVELEAKVAERTKGAAAAPVAVGAK
jgi:ParB/RepB/Spo0J family partition protein